MASFEHSESVLELGQKLVNELVLDQFDTLGRWMAHYIAEKIAAAQSAGEEERQQRLSECCDEILRLWSHRRNFDRSVRPLESFEPVFRALNSLDPDNASNRFFDRVEEDNESDETREWLRLASEADEAARHVISHCLSRAADSSLNREREWVTLASRFSMNDDDFKALSQLLGEKNYAAKRKKELVNKLELLSAISLSAVTCLQSAQPPKQPKTKKKAKSPQKKIQR
jgi:hypothetical protein